jgi:hypothetical protein
MLVSFPRIRVNVPGNARCHKLGRIRRSRGSGLVLKGKGAAPVIPDLWRGDHWGGNHIT